MAHARHALNERSFMRGSQNRESRIKVSDVRIQFVLLLRNLRKRQRNIITGTHPSTR
jgi:hypothetical protein